MTDVAVYAATLPASRRRSQPTSKPWTCTRVTSLGLVPYADES